MERGEKAPTIVTLEAFARGLGVRIGDLADEAAQRAKPSGDDQIERIATMLRHRPLEYQEAVERMLRVMDRVLEAGRNLGG